MGVIIPYNPAKHHRRSIRLKGYDYAQEGAYFITICAYRHTCLFGEVLDESMNLNVYDEIVRDEWIRTATIRQEVELDSFVVMPNHFHGIVLIVSQDVRERTTSSELAGVHNPRPYRSAKSIGALVAGFKSAVTAQINRSRTTPGLPVWQPNYHEHIIRSENSLNILRSYIETNPSRWASDKYNPLKM